MFVFRENKIVTCLLEVCATGDRSTDNLFSRRLMTTSKPTVTSTYQLDKDYRIVSVGGIWDEFALDNGGETVCGCDVRGRAVWDFITGDVTRMWLRTLFEFARLNDETLERPYRCDSAHLKRFMRMTVVPDIDGLLRIDHELLATEERSVPIHIQYAAKQITGGFKVRCSLCGRLKVGASWQEPTAEHDQPPTKIAVVYSVCDDCGRALPGSIAC